MPPDHRSPRLLEAIADGTPVDWAAERAVAADESDSDTLARIERLDRVVRLHRTMGVAANTQGDGRGAALLFFPHTRPSADDPTAAPAEAPDLGRWGPLRLIERIGGGTFGDVYRAWDERLDRQVALKLLHRVRHDSDRLGSRVIEEGRLLARVRHPNIATVFGADRIDGRVGVWMEFVEGRTLERILRESGRFGAREAALVGLDLCRALSAVHRAGLLHHDVKAQNVMREVDGRLVLVDFGAGREVPPHDEDGPVDAAGTPLYLAPERFEGSAGDARSDIYSLGVLLYHLVTGAYPVSASNGRALREAHRERRRSLLRDERPDLPPAFIDAVERALAHDPADRFASAGAMEAALARSVTGVDAAAPDSTRTHVRRPFQVVLAMLTLAVVAGLGLLGDKGPLDRLREQLSRSGAGSGPPRVGGGVGGVTTEPDFAVRRVLQAGEYSVLGLPSRDGRYFPFVKPDGNVALKEMSTGTVRDVTNKGQSAEEGWGRPIVSPDGALVAYGWIALDGTHELRTIRIDGTWPRVLVRRAEFQEPEPIEWSTDGKHLLARCWLKDLTTRLALVSLSDGEVRILKDTGAASPHGASLSPDGRFVVYDRPSPANRAARDLYVLSLDGAGEWPLVEHPANDMFPQWLDDGRVLFTSDRTGALGLWAIPVAGGRATGEVEVVSRDMGRMTPLGATRTGAFYYRFETGLVDVYTVAIDPTTLTVTHKPEPVTVNRIGSNISSDWSPGGDRVAYVKIRNPAGPAQADLHARMLAILDVDSGRTRDLWPALRFFIAPRWSPDGRTIAVSGTDGRNRFGFHLIDSESGRLTGYVSGSTDEAMSWSRWDRDGRRVLFGRGTAVMSHDPLTGDEKALFDIKAVGVERFSPPVFGTPFELSPDGRWLAFSGWVGTGKEARSVLFVVPLDGGSPRELRRVPGPLFFQGWLRNSTALLFTTRPSADSQAFTLWSLALTGGAPHAVGLELEGLRDAHVNAGGSRLTFTAGWQTGEVRVMEHFLAEPR